ncbi:MAG: tRNA (guanosine(37)-N1)-methyltransferase TrmD, partial [Clostridia bacterium]|nr:tRNA (guanosine(37)-N1)-methyltransferase TrmD [Clostridia bacterium]
MRFDVLTLFPDMIKSVTDASILGKAQKSGIIDVNIHNIRDFSKDKHRKVDDTPYGGGMGMLMS